MCLIACAWQSHPRWPLVLIGNRDEFHARPTQAAAFLDDAASIYGGRDLDQGGGWLQLSTARRLAAVTNVRVGTTPPAAPRSRGALVSGFVRGDDAAHERLAGIAPQAQEYGRFNLLLWDGDSLRLASNHPHFGQRPVEAGVFGVSNGSLDADWPKLRRVQDALRQWLDAAQGQARGDVSSLFDALADTRPAADPDLPDTGVGVELERMLSPPFIRGERYGTRCSSVVLVGHDSALFAERRFGPLGVALGESSAQIALR